jgi:hypothetical protein
MDKTRGYQASIDYLMPIVTHPVMTGEYCRHLRNSIDAMIKFERIQSELERLNAENAKLQAELALLHKVVEAARDVVGFGACHDENSLWSIKALQNTIENYEGWKKEGD